MIPWYGWLTIGIIVGIILLNRVQWFRRTNDGNRARGELPFRR